MYLPPHFRIEDRAELLAGIRLAPLGLLISLHEGEASANPVPFTLAGTEAAPLLRAHLARPNPQLAALKANARALVVFTLTEHYVSPSWYPSKAETHKVVPTWNYAMVQARGQATIEDNPEWLRAQIGALTDRHEGSRKEPWRVEDAPDDFIAKQMRGIVGIEIAVESLVGKYKLSQNRSEADHAGVIGGFEADGDAGLMAEMMRRHARRS